MNTTDETGQDTTERDTSHATDETLVVSVQDAAAILGISASAVRKRLERGKLSGSKSSGQWQVFLGSDTSNATTGQDRTRQEHDNTTGRDATDETEPGDVVSRSGTELYFEALSDHLALIRSQGERLERQAHMIGELQERNRSIDEQLAAVSLERDALIASQTSKTASSRDDVSEGDQSHHGAYLETWDRDVGAVEDPDIAGPGLDGVDTADRSAAESSWPDRFRRWWRGS